MIIKKITIILIFLILTGQVTAQIPAPADNRKSGALKRVVVLHSFHKGQQWNDELSKGIEDILKTNQVELNFEYMDAIRYFEDPYFGLFAELLEAKYKHRGVDIVISTDEDALNFVLWNRATIFPNTTIVYCGIKRYIDRFWEKNLTGVIESADMLNNIKLAKEINPTLNHVFVVMDNTPTSISQITNIIPLFREFTPEISFQFSEFVVFEDILKRIKALSQNSAVLLVNYTNDKEGRVISMNESARRISEVSPVPVYSLWDSYIGSGVIGGKMASAYKQGHTAGELALRILGGEPVERIPVLNSIQNEYIFDYRQLKRFGIKELNLPENSIIRYKPNTLYQRYRRAILFMVVGGITLTFIIILLSMNIIRRRRVEIALKRYSDRLNFFHQIDQNILTDFSIESLAENILSPTLKSTKNDLIGVYLYQRDQLPEWGIAIAGKEVQKKIYGIRILYDKLPPKLVTTGKPFNIRRGTIYQNCLQFSQDSLTPYNDLILIPLMYKSSLLGVLYLANKENKSINYDQETIGQQVADSLAMAFQNDYFMREIKTHEAKLRHMSLNILDAQEMERKRLSAELHDEFGQTLTAIGINFGMIWKKLGKNPPVDIQHRIEYIEKAIDQLSDQVHDLSLDLRPPMLDDLGLLPTLRWFLTEYRKRSKFKITMSFNEDQAEEIPAPVAVTLYRVLQEALNNITKHANASIVNVSLEGLNGLIKLSISDNGIGFDFNKVRFEKLTSRGLGLIGMRERLDLIHGKLLIHSDHKQGTIIEAEVPLDINFYVTKN